MPVCGDKKRNQLLIERFRDWVDVNGSGQLGHEFLTLHSIHDFFSMSEESCELPTNSLSIRVGPWCDLVPP